MKIKDNVELSILEKYGFEKCDEDWKSRNNDILDLVLRYHKGYLFYLGKAGMGQHYYLLVEMNRKISIYAKTPSGWAGNTKKIDIILQLYKDSIIE